MMNNLLTKLIKIADKLDQQGKENLADLVDSAARTIQTKNAVEIEELIKKLETESLELDQEPTKEELDAFMGEEEDHE